MNDQNVPTTGMGVGHFSAHSDIYQK